MEFGNAVFEFCQNLEGQPVLSKGKNDELQKAETIF
jgi:hypothetical protein